MGLSIATWNVNSVRRRLPGLARLAAEAAPDVICLQETKVEDPDFPALEVAALGYPHQAIHGMKGYNGVALLSRRPLRAIGTRAWCGRDDRRHIFATVDDAELGAIEVHSLYLPAGGDLPKPERNPKFAHKLEFLRDQARWWAQRNGAGRPTVLAGDLNVAPLECDVWSHERLRNVVTHTAVEREMLRAMAADGGWVDAVRHLIAPPERVFTWWSYRTPDWAVADKGRRLDHVWVTPDLAPSLAGVTILRDARGWDVPSDHVPVIVTLRHPTERGA